MSVPKKILTRRPTRTSHNFILKKAEHVTDTGTIISIDCTDWQHWGETYPYQSWPGISFTLGKTILSPLLQGCLQLCCLAIAWHAMGMVLQTVQWSLCGPCIPTLLQTMLSPMQECCLCSPEEEHYPSCFIVTCTQLTLWSNFTL